MWEGARAAIVSGGEDFGRRGDEGLGGGLGQRRERARDESSDPPRRGWMRKAWSAGSQVNALHVATEAVELFHVAHGVDLIEADVVEELALVLRERILGGAIAMDGRERIVRRSTDASEGITRRGSARAGRRWGEVRERAGPADASGRARGARAGRGGAGRGPRRVRRRMPRATGTVDRAVPHRRYSTRVFISVASRCARPSARRAFRVGSRARQWKSAHPPPATPLRTRAVCQRAPRALARRAARPARPFRRANALPPRLARPPPPPPR